jgi:hypothetical protein
MFKKVMCLVVCGMMLAGSALAYTVEELDKGGVEIGKINSTKCIVLAKMSVNAYKFGIDTNKISLNRWIENRIKEMKNIHMKMDDGTILEYSQEDIDKTVEIFVNMYNSGVEDRVNHGWKPMLFNRTISSIPMSIGSECVMQNLYE